MSETKHLLDIRGLETHFDSASGVVRAVDGVSFHVDEGETVGLVGESGCGKSVTALSIMKLVPDPPGHIVGGQVLFDGRDLVPLPNHEMNRVRGSQIGMIFQEPMTSLNPVLTIGRQITEPLELHEGMTKGQSKARAAELLSTVGLPDAERRLNDYPHQLSGGQRQRVMIAMALACSPRLLIADEATTALDVTIQAQVLELMKSLTERMGTAVLLITHNLGVVARYADHVEVMYAGKIRESAEADALYSHPAHPYTKALLDSVPRMDRPMDEGLLTIRGETPVPTMLPAGCAFRPRCDYAVARCEVEDPGLARVDGEHLSACWEAGRVFTGGESRTGTAP